MKCPVFKAIPAGMENPDRIAMSKRERDLLKVLSNVVNKSCSQIDAARFIGRSTRQVRRLLRRLERDGDSGVLHKLRGRPSNNRAEPALRTRALHLVRERYVGFGPTFASEKLLEEHGIDVSVQTLRTWMLAEGLWKIVRDRNRHRARRPRRACFGEMVLADASDHDWLEGRGPRLVLVGMIDDATNRIELLFAEAETTRAYMDLLERWLGKHGRPRSWYTDRHRVFHAEATDAAEGHKVRTHTQFSRALEQLEIGLILANSPQAKGRVERLWGTAQDRLVKELRLAMASTLAEANATLPKFVGWYNRARQRKATSGADAHRDLSGVELSQVLCEQHERVVMNDYTINFEGRSYQLLPPALPGQRGGRVTIERTREGSLRMRFGERYLKFEDVGENAHLRAKRERQQPRKPALSLETGMAPDEEHTRPRCA